VIPDAAMSWRIPVGAVAARLRTGVTRPGAEHFAVAGEVDAAEAAALTDALLEVLRATACPVVVLDLAEVTFLGSRGLSMIVAAAREAARHDVELRGVTGPDDRAVIRALEVTGVSESIAWFPSTDRAGSPTS
jgi:anti-anti-sigma factor